MAFFSPLLQPCQRERNARRTSERGEKSFSFSSGAESRTRRAQSKKLSHLQNSRVLPEWDVKLRDRTDSSHSPSLAFHLFLHSIFIRQVERKSRKNSICAINNFNELMVVVSFDLCRKEAKTTNNRKMSSFGERLNCVYKGRQSCKRAHSAEMLKFLSN